MYKIEYLCQLFTDEKAYVIISDRTLIYKHEDL